MKWLKLLLTIAALMAGVTHAQVNRVPQIGVVDSQGATQVNTAGLKDTYVATVVGVAPASSATDVACLGGTSTRTVQLTRVTVSGTAGTLITLPVKIQKNALADSGGTGAAASVVVRARMRSTSPGSGAVVTAYTANPTINDGAPGTVGVATLTLPVTSAGTSSSRAVFDWGLRGGERPPTLVGTAQQICVNLSGVSVSSGLVYVDFTWTEEPN